VAKPKVDPIAWAKAAKPVKCGQRCRTCANAEAAAVIKKWVPMWRSGEIRISVQQARNFLAEHCGYEPAVETLRNCLTNHHGYTPNG
jgi:hypothetical protein